MRRRTRAREIAVQFLYQLDLRGDETQEFLHEYVEGETTDKEMREFAIRLIQGSRRHQEGTDSRLREVTRNWDLSRPVPTDGVVHDAGNFGIIWDFHVFMNALNQGRGTITYPYYGYIYLLQISAPPFQQ